MRLSLLPLVLACGCATDVASKADLRALQEQVQSLQRENTALAQRLQAVEHERVPAAPAAADPGAPAAASAAAVSPAPATDGALPALTVVKLKPKGAPPIDVRTPVQEPDPALREELETLTEAGARWRALPSSSSRWCSATRLATWCRTRC